jgi:type IV secretion system protein TrbD
MEGFEIPIHRSLTQPIMIAGVPREIAILNGTFSSALVLGLHSWLGIPLGLVLHALFLSMAKRDPQFFATFRRHIKHRRYYGV